jgi:NADPH2:quinone reductase
MFDLEWKASKRKSMKAIRVHEFGGPEVLRLEEVPKPQPGPGEVLIRMHAIGVNPVETYIRAGTYARLPALPYTPGNDGAGVVEQIGDSVTEFKPGDRVYTGGSLTGSTYAEFALCKTAQVHPLPANVSFAQGAAMGTPYATAYRGLLQRADAKPGETVLVHGASGGVGTAAVQLALARGLRVFGTAGSDEGRKLAREQGAHEVFDHRAPDHFEQIMKATGGRGVDVIVELLANVNLGKDLTILAKGGRVAIIGSRGRVEIDPRDTMQRDADLRGMALPNTPPEEMASIHAALVAGLENGTLRPVIGKEFPLAEAAQAHRAVMEPGATGKIVLVPEK